MPTKPLYNSSTSTGQGGKHDEKVYGSKWGQGYHLPITITGKKGSAWGNQFNLLPFQNNNAVRNKNYLAIPSSLPSSTGAWGMEVTMSSLYFVSAAFSNLCSSPGPVWSPSHCIQYGLTFSGVSFPWVHRSIKSAPAWAFHGVTSSFWVLLPAQAWDPPQLQWEQPALPWFSQWDAGESLFQCLKHLITFCFQWPWCLHSCFLHIFSLFLSRCVKCFLPLPIC